MAFLDELMRTPGSVGTTDIRQYLAPIMEAMAGEAKRAADPLTRISDVGTAMLSAAGGGQPYAQVLGALDAQRKEAVRSGANMFLNVLGQERQLEAMKQNQEFRNASLMLQMLGMQPNIAQAVMQMRREMLAAGKPQSEIDNAVRQLIEGQRSTYPGGVTPATRGDPRAALTPAPRTAQAPTTPSTTPATTPSTTAAKPLTLYDMAEDTTGVSGAVTQAWVDVMGQIPGFGPGPQSKATVTRRQIFDAAVNDLIRGFAVNPRYAEGELKRLRKEIDISPDIFTGAEGLRARMRGVDAMLATKETNLATSVNNPDLTMAQRTQDQQTLTAIRNFRRLMGAPQAPSGVPSGSFREGFDKEGNEVWRDPAGQRHRVKKR